MYLEVISMDIGGWNTPERKAWIEAGEKLREAQNQVGPLSTEDIRKAEERAANN